jgi:hypothetical protein
MRAAPCASFDHLVGAGEQRGRNINSGRLCSFEIDHKLDFCDLLHRQIGSLFAAQDAAGPGDPAPK